MGLVVGLVVGAVVGVVGVVGGRQTQTQSPPGGVPEPPLEYVVKQAVSFSE